MKVLGEEITQTAQQSVRGYMAIEEHFTVAGVRGVLEANLLHVRAARRRGIAMRTADRLIQIERIAGNVEHGRGRGVWRWVA